MQLWSVWKKNFSLNIHKVLLVILPGHCLNLLVKHSLEECSKVDALIKTCDEWVMHFKRCELNCMFSNFLKQQYDTLCNTVYDMLYSIELKWIEFQANGIYSVRTERILTIWIKLIIHYWSVANIVSYFKKASEQLSADQEPTLHLVLPWINNLKNLCEVKNTESAVIKQLKKNILNQIDQCGIDTTPRYYYISSRSH